jgi:hypothetical protein
VARGAVGGAFDNTLNLDNKAITPKYIHENKEQSRLKPNSVIQPLNSIVPNTVQSQTLKMAHG